MSGGRRQDGGARAVKERVAAARRAAQLRQEAEERVEAEAKLDTDEPVTVNDMLAMLGSAFRVPEQADPWEASKQAYSDGDIEGNVVGQLVEWLKEHHPKPDAEPTRSTPKRRKGDQAYTFTAEDITKLRDEQGLSWRQVAINLDLGSPGMARKAYSDLTGRSYHDSVMTGRRAKSDPLRSVRPRRKVFAPEWTDESDQDEIIERVTGATIVVERTLRGVQTEEEISVGKVTKLTWDGKDQHLCVHFSDRYSGGARAVHVHKIKEVR